MTFNDGVQIDPGRASGGGGGRGRGLAVGGGVGGLALVLVAVLLGVDPSTLGLGEDPGTAPATQGQGFERCTTGAAANADVDCRIIATAESLDAVWEELLPAQAGTEYTQPGLEIFAGQTSTACGAATSAVGPFYCPGDATVYVDSSFFDVLVRDYGSAGGPLAQEYVVAHEFGHAVSDQLGLLRQAQQDPTGAASGSVRAELQADCLAGVWANRASTVPDPDTGVPFLAPLTATDVSDALSAAASVGDDRIQQSAGGRADPESFTHGTSAQRQRWFSTGYEGGDLRRCDTFAATDLG